MSVYPAATFENRGAKHRVLVSVDIDDYHLASIITTAIEGGINYWCPAARLHEPYAIERDAHEVWNEFFARNIVLGGSATFVEDCGEGDEPREHVLTAEKLLAGVGKWIDHLAQHNSRPAFWRDGEQYEWDIDASDADNILQFALFGELVYG